MPLFLNDISFSSDTSEEFNFDDAMAEIDDSHEFPEEWIVNPPTWAEEIPSESIQQSVIPTESSESNHQGIEETVKPIQDPSSNFMDPSKICETCGKTFKTTSILNRHRKIHSGEKPFVCELCQKAFTRNSHLLRHEISHIKGYTCSKCLQKFTLKSEFIQHKRVSHPAPPKRKSESSATSIKRVKKLKSALGVFNVSTLTPSDESSRDLETFFKVNQSNIYEKLHEALEDHRSVKWYGVARVVMKKTGPDGEESKITPYFSSKCLILLTEDKIYESIGEAKLKIIKNMEDFVQNGSGWIFEKVEYFDINMAKYRPLAASSYVPLPKKIAVKKGIINIKNEDNKCFLWCILAHKFNIPWKDRPHHVSHYVSHESEINMGNVEFPVPLSKVPVIEKLNNLRINVYGYEDEIFPLYISSRTREGNDCLNLLLISRHGRQHYCLIRDMLRLLD